MEDLLLEGNLFGERIDKTKLSDDSYVRELTKKIRETDKETYSDRKNKQILFTILSTASIIGIVTIPLSFDACVKKLENIENTEKELDNLSKIIDKQISNVNKDKNLSIDEKKNIINKLEKNKSIIYKKYTIKKTASNSASSYDGDSIKCGNILLRSLAGSVMNGDLLDIDIEYKLDTMNDHKKKYKDNMHFEGYIEELAVFGLNNSSNLMKYIEKNKGNANHYRNDFPKLEGKTLTKIISFTGPDIVVYCHEDTWCYRFSPKYTDEGIKKCSVSQLIQAINKSYKDLLNLQKSISESVKGRYNMDNRYITEGLFDSFKPVYRVSDRPLRVKPTNGGFDTAQIAVKNYGIYILNMKEVNGNLLYTDDSILNKKVYINKIGKYDITTEDDGKYKDLCNKYDITLKPVSKTAIKNRDKVFKKALSLVKIELNKYKELKAAVELNPKSNDYKGFINGSESYITLFYLDMFKLTNNPKDLSDPTLERIAFDPINDIVKKVNKQLPKGYKVDTDGDTKNIYLELTCSDYMNEGEIVMDNNYSVINESFYSDYEYAMEFNANNYKSLPPTMLRGHKTTLENKINKYEQNLKKFKKMDSKERERYIRKLNVAGSVQNVGLGIAGGLATGVVVNKYDGGLSVSNYQKLTENMIRKLKVELKNIDNILKSKSAGKKIREMADLASSDNYGLYNSNILRDEIRESYIDTINSLDTINSNIIRKDTSLLPIYKIDEGYGIELESLKQVVESTGSLSEAVQEIRDVNNIMEVCPMYCILPENINESITLENFVTLYKSLEKADIKPVSTNAHIYEQ